MWKRGIDEKLKNLHNYEVLTINPYAGTTTTAQGKEIKIIDFNNFFLREKLPSIEITYFYLNQTYVLHII